MSAIILATALVAAADPATTLVGGWGQDAADPARLRAQEAVEVGLGRTVLSHAELLHNLWGTAAPAPFAKEDVLAKLEQARAREADFDTAAANTLRRQVVDTFDHALQPDAE